MSSQFIGIPLKRMGARCAPVANGPRLCGTLSLHDLVSGTSRNLRMSHSTQDSQHAHERAVW